MREKVPVLIFSRDFKCKELGKTIKKGRYEFYDRKVFDILKPYSDNLGNGGVNKTKAGK